MTDAYLEYFVNNIYSELLDGNFHWLELVFGTSISDKIKNSAVKSNIEKYQTAISEILENGNKDLSEATKQVVATEGIDLSGSAESLIESAATLLQKIKAGLDAGTITLSSYNDSAALILEKSLFEKGGKNGKLLSFASSDINVNTIKELVTGFGKQLDEVVDLETGAFKNELNSVIQYNPINNKYEIQGSFNEFITVLEKTFGTAIDRTSQEYIDALSAYNDS